MAYKDNQPYIYLRSTRERIPCTQEEFDNYYHDINIFRIRQQRRGMCVCPASKRLDCDMDCATCPFRRGGAILSLNKTVEDEDGNEVEWGDLIEDTTIHFDEDIAKKHEMQELLTRLAQLMPEAIQIGEMRMKGYTNLEISKELGVLNTTLCMRLKKVKKQMQIEFPQFF